MSSWCFGSVGVMCSDLESRSWQVTWKDDGHLYDTHGELETREDQSLDSGPLLRLSRECAGRLKNPTYGFGVLESGMNSWSTGGCWGEAAWTWPCLGPSLDACDLSKWLHFSLLHSHPWWWLIVSMRLKPSLRSRQTARLISAKVHDPPPLKPHSFLSGCSSPCLCFCF